MFKNHYTETLLVVLSIVMGLIMAISVIIIDGLGFNFSTVFSNWSMITMVVLLTSIFVPYKAWSARFVRLFKVREGSLLWKLIDGIIPSLVLNTLNTVIVAAANILYNEAIPVEAQVPAWISGVVHDWPITFVISYFAAFVAEWCGKKVADRYTLPVS